MTEVVVDIHSITSASGWYFSAAKTEVGQILGATEPVLCLALVSVMDTSHPTLAPTKRVIALDHEHYGDILGMAVEDRHTNIEFRDPTHD